GVMSAFVALALVRGIGLFPDLAYVPGFATSLTAPAASGLGLWAVPIPAIGGVIVGLMARYGSDRIRGHGIPEALEAILIGRSRMDPKVAVLKPLSSAIAIGTGGPYGAEGPLIVTGGAVGSLFAQAFHLSSAARRTLLAARIGALGWRSMGCSGRRSAECSRAWAAWSRTARWAGATPSSTTWSLGGCWAPRSWRCCS